MLLLLLAGWCVYHPGLSGGFVFDDFGNLPALGDYGRIDNATAFWRYLTSGFADPTGRPLSLLTFLLDARDWPADPAPFKRTNVLIHLINGALLCALLWRLGLAGALPRQQTALAALTGAALWLLHPLWASTTLYIVQRETMLSGTFILLGLLCYLHGRQMLADRPWRGAAWIVGGVGFCTVLGTLAKANGILLPTYILVVEWVFLRATPTASAPSRAFSRCLTIAVYPLVAVTAMYLLYEGVRGLASGILPGRTWTLGQRLLTEPRVLADYLQCLFIPRPYSIGLFNDGYPVSQDWLHPWTTIPALSFVIALIVGAVAVRRRNRFLALAVLFYFAGHALESTTIPLELYFEHRNYVPAMLLFWPLAIGLTDGGERARLKALAAIGLIALLATETFFAARLWGDQKIQALVWAQKNPDSARAQAFAATAERSMRLYAQSEERLRTALNAQPSEVQLAVGLLRTRCILGSISEGDLALAETAIKTGNSHGQILLDWIPDAFNLIRDETCRGLTLPGLQRLIDAAWENARMKDDRGYRQSLLDLEGQIALLGNDASLAQKKFREALEYYPNPDIALEQAAILGSNGLPQSGLDQLAWYRQLVPQETVPAIRNMQSLHRWLLYKEGYWDHEMVRMREALLEDIAIQKKTGGISTPHDVPPAQDPMPDEPHF